MLLVFILNLVRCKQCDDDDDDDANMKFDICSSVQLAMLLFVKLFCLFDDDKPYCVSCRV